jgi:hypothetical protein
MVSGRRAFQHVFLSFRVGQSHTVYVTTVYVRCFQHVVIYYVCVCKVLAGPTYK